MSGHPSIPLEPIRLLFELERADNPRLYDDLIQFKKGIKRVNRLRTLAHEGLLAQYWPAGFTGAGNAMARRDRDDSALTSPIFDEPLTE